MSRIDELIAELAPNGVEFRALGEVLRIKNGRDHKPLGAGDVPVYGSGGIMRYVDTAAAEGPSVLIPRKGSLGNIFYVEGPFWVVDTIFRTEIDSSQVEPKFVYYQLLTMKLNEMNQAGGVPSQTQTVLNSLRIPVPPLVVQREVVRVLDQFTRLEAELEVELEARRNQRSALAVNFEVALKEAGPDEFEIAKLGDLVQESKSPVSLQDDELYVTVGVRWNGEGVLLRNPKRGGEIKAQTLYRVQPGQLIYNRMFVVEGSFAVVPPEARGAVVSEEFPVFDINEKRVNPHWLINFVTSKHTLSRIEREVTGTERGSMKSRRRWKSDQLKSFHLLLPSLERQLREVELLRTCDDLMFELKAELAARRKQYEYYRDKLLTFTGAAA